MRGRQVRGLTEVYVRVRSAEQLRDRIHLRRFSYRELGGMVGCHHSFIGHLVAGRTLTCSKELAVKLEKVLGVEPGDLFEPNEHRRRPRSSNVQTTTRRSA